ncbi:MAG: DUF1697 domain-containing protein [Bacteroidetes bacterium]|nr:DUF1697 domain-containing protein [Bacteroidota bacterium]
MKTYISILRGINVSGHKSIKMDALKKMYADIGFSGVQTYIQSGNVIFRFKDTKTELLENMIHIGLKKTFGFEVPVIVRELTEFKKVLDKNPFLKNKRAEDTSKLHVTFLSSEPEKENSEKIKKGEYGSDEFFISGNTIYLFIPDKYGNTKLSNTFFENKLKVSATTRNWNTVNEIVRLAETDN